MFPCVAIPRVDAEGFIGHAIVGNRNFHNGIRRRKSPHINAINWTFGNEVIRESNGGIVELASGLAFNKVYAWDATEVGIEAFSDSFGRDADQGAIRVCLHTAGGANAGVGKDLQTVPEIHGWEQQGNNDKTGDEQERS